MDGNLIKDLELLRSYLWVVERYIARATRQVKIDSWQDEGLRIHLLIKERGV